jgi:hypothetical protein
MAVFGLFKIMDSCLLFENSGYQFLFEELVMVCNFETWIGTEFL